MTYLLFNITLTPYLFSLSQHIFLNLSELNNFEVARLMLLVSSSLIFLRVRPVLPQKSICQRFLIWFCKHDCSQLGHSTCVIIPNVMSMPTPCPLGRQQSCMSLDNSLLFPRPPNSKRFFLLTRPTESRIKYSEISAFHLQVTYLI